MFGFLGRSHELKRLDQAVRAVGLHPILVPEAVKLTTVRLLKDDAYDAAAEARLEAALEVGDSLDARLVLLALHAGVIQEQVVERYQLEAE